MSPLPMRWSLCVLPALVVATGCAPTAYKITPVPADQELEEKTLINEGGLAPAKIVLVDVDGIILNGHKPSLFGQGENPVALFVENLDKAAKDASVKALVLRINSPGGSVTGSDIMYNEVLHYKQCAKDRPVVAVMMDVTASGGYYLSCACDEIVAQPTTVTGSIGVIMQMINVAGTMRKIGIDADAIKSGRMKDAGSPLREMKPEEREIFQKLVNQFFDRFVEVVATGRHMESTQVREIADGRVYSAQQALDLKLIDRIGSLRDALCSVKEKIGAKRVKVVTYHRPLGYKPNIYADTPAGPPQMNVFNIQLPSSLLYSEAQFMYLWSPGT